MCIYTSSGCSIPVLSPQRKLLPLSAARKSPKFCRIFGAVFGSSRHNPANFSQILGRFRQPGSQISRRYPRKFLQNLAASEEKLADQSSRKFRDLSGSKFSQVSCFPSFPLSFNPSFSLYFCLSVSLFLSSSFSLFPSFFFLSFSLSLFLSVFLSLCFSVSLSLCLSVCT